MKIMAKFFVIIVVALAVFCITVASCAVTTFETGPFNGSIDLGVPCKNIDNKEPAHGELISGLNYTEYVTSLCGAAIDLMKFNNTSFDLNGSLDVGVKSDLLDMGADKDTILVYRHVVDSKPGAVGSGYVPKHDLTLYVSSFYVSPNTVGHIYVWENQTKMVSALKTIHITEAVQ